MARELLLGALLSLLLTFGCGGDSSSAVDSTTDAAPQIYEVRGMVRRLPVADAPVRELYVHHEPIDDFVDITGQTVGMDSMTMPFILAEDLKLEDIGPGDKVRVRIEVDWNAPRPATVTAVERLPAETELEFGPSQPPS